MINIKIDDDYKIVNDERNIILQSRSVIKGDNTKGKQANPENIGKETWSNVGFHRTIREAIENYTRERILKSNAKTFEELYRLLDEIKDILNKIKDIDNLIDKSIIVKSVVDNDKKIDENIKIGRNKNERIVSKDIKTIKVIKDKSVDKKVGKTSKENKK